MSEPTEVVPPSPPVEETASLLEEPQPVEEPQVVEEPQPVETESLEIETESLKENAETVEEKEPLIVDTNQVIEDVKTLSSVIGLIVATNSDMQQYKMDISPKIKALLEKLLGEMKYFDQVEEYLKAIIKDDKLDAKDVPIVMLLLTELYERLQTFSMEDIRSEDCADLLKIMFEVAIKEKIIKISSEDLELLSAIYNIIDTSVKLIKTPNILDESGEPTSKRGLLYCLTHYICNMMKGSSKKEDE